MLVAGHRSKENMKLNNRTILLTGGTSGIGHEFTKQLLAKGNKVIITGRDAGRLEEAQSSLPGVDTIQSDVSDPVAIAELYSEVVRRYPGLDMLINNAGAMRKINLLDRSVDLLDITKEVETNLMGPIRMVKQFLSLLSSRSEAAIVNVTSGLAFIPFPISPIYCATKAALHSYTQSLRVQLKNTKIKVIELAPPSIQTPLQKSFTAVDLKGAPMMKAGDLIRAAIRGIENDHEEILPGFSKVLRMLSRIAPAQAVKLASRPVDALLAQTEM